MSRPLAHRNGPPLIVALLVAKGSACPECGYATRNTSKRWAACKRTECGRMKIPRRTWDEASEMVREAVT